MLIAKWKFQSAISNSTNDQRPTTNDQRLTTNDQRLTTNDLRLRTEDYWFPVVLAADAGFTFTFTIAVVQQQPVAPPPFSEKSLIVT